MRFTLEYRQPHRQNTGYVIHDILTNTDLKMPYVDYTWQYQAVVDLLNQLWEQVNQQADNDEIHNRPQSR